MPCLDEARISFLCSPTSPNKTGFVEAYFTLHFVQSEIWRRGRDYSRRPAARPYGLSSFPSEIQTLAIHGAFVIPNHDIKHEGSNPYRMMLLLFLSSVFCFKWRRGRDSNPRGLAPSRFPGECTRPAMRPLHVQFFDTLRYYIEYIFLMQELTPNLKISLFQIENRLYYL